MKKKNAKQANFAIRKLSALENAKLTTSFSLPEQSKAAEASLQLGSLVNKIIANDKVEQLLKSAQVAKLAQDMPNETLANTELALKTEAAETDEASKTTELVESNLAAKQTVADETVAAEIPENRKKAEIGEIAPKEAEDKEVVPKEAEAKETEAKEAAAKEAAAKLQVPSYSLRILNLRQALQSKASRKDEKLAGKTKSSLVTALEEHVDTEINKAIANFKIPEKISERYALARKLHLIEESTRKRRFKLQKVAITVGAATDQITAVEARIKLAESCKLIDKAYQDRRLFANRAYRQISDEMLQTAYLNYLKNGEYRYESDANKNGAKLAANKRRQARIRLLNQHKAEKVKALFRKKYKFQAKTEKKKRSLKFTWQLVNNAIRKLRISAAVLTLLVGIALSLFALLPQFYLKNIQIVGNEHLSTAELTEFLKVKKGQHLITLLKGNLWQIFQGRNTELEQKLKDNYPIISKVQCTVKIPGTLELKIKESTAIAYLNVQGGYANIDAEGRILAINLGETDDNVPLIKGLDTRYVQVNQICAEIKQRSFTNAIVLMDNLMRSDADSADHLKLIAALKTIHLMPDASLWLQFDFARSANLQATSKLSTSSSKEDELLVHIGSEIADYANLIYWLRNSKQVGVLDNLESGYLDLTHKQKVFVKSADNTETQIGQKGKLKAEPWDNSAWTWKDIVVKSFKKKVGD